MKLKREILLCFSSQDDLPLEGDQKGWVSNFYRFFATLLSQITREEANIKLVSEKEIGNENIDEAAVVMVVETQSLTSDPSFVKKLNEFGKHAKAANLFLIDGLPRLFKIHKGPFEDDGKLSEFGQLIPYDFFMRCCRFLWISFHCLWISLDFFGFGFLWIGIQFQLFS